MLFFFLKLYRLIIGNMIRRGDREKILFCCVLRMEIYWKLLGGFVMELVFYRVLSTFYREIVLLLDKLYGLILGDMSVFLKIYWDLLGMWLIWVLEVYVVFYRNIFFFIVFFCFE